MAFVQKADSGVLTTGVTTKSTAAFPANVTAGNFLWAVVTWGAPNATPSSVTINGSAATAIGSPIQDGPNSQNAQLYFVLNATGGSTTGGTVNFASANDFVGIMVCEESGVLTSAATDGNGNVFVTPSATTGTTSSFTTTQANDLIIVGFVDSSGTTTAINTPTATNATLTNRDSTVNGSIVEMAAASGAQTSSGSTTATWTWTTSANALIMAAAFKTSGGAAPDQPPSEVWFEVSAETFNAPDQIDGSIFDWYADNTANRADVVPPIAPYLPDSFEWEDPDRWNDAVWLWPLSQAPPPGDFFPDYIRPQDGSDQLEDRDEDFAFAIGPLPADVSAVVSTPAPQLPDLPEAPDEDFGYADAPLAADVVAAEPLPDIELPDLPEEPDEDFGFKDDQLPDDILDQLNNTFSGYFGEPDEVEWFTFIQDPSDTDSVVDPVYPDNTDDQQEDAEDAQGFADAPLGDDPQDLPQVEDSSDQQEDLAEDFGFARSSPGDGPVADQAPTEDSSDQIEDADEDFGFADQPLADDNEVGIHAEFPDQAEEPEDEPFAFSADPLPDDVQSDQVFVEDATQQPPDPEDEDFGQSFDPIAPDLVIESDQVFVEDARNQEGELPSDEDFGFSADPTPEDAIPVPLTIVDTHDGARKRRKTEEERKRREQLRRETIENLVSPKPVDTEILETPAQENTPQVFNPAPVSVILAPDAETPDDDEDDIEAILLLMRP